MWLRRSLSKKTSIILLLLIIAGCKKDKISPVCRSFGPAPGFFGWQEIYEAPYVARPDFNPDNANEFLFVYYPPGGSNSLYKYNMLTKELKLIFTGTTMVYRSRYGRNGWIMLNLIDGNIWKIKDNGDSLTQLTNTGNCYHPHWNYKYDRIGYETNSNGYYYGVIINPAGNYIDTVHYGWDEITTWLSRRYIVNAMLRISTYEIETDEYNVIKDFETASSGAAYGVAILRDDNTIIWSYKEGIFETTIDSRNTRSLYPSCNSRRFYDASYAPTTDKLLWQRLDYRPVEDSSILHIKSTIVMMNTDGTGEEKIEIPLP
jgi:hypothetical protein